MDKSTLYTHTPKTTPKPPQPNVVTALKAGLHPASKTVQGLLGVNQKKTNG